MIPHMESIRLNDIAHARSGDKGNHANIGVIAWTPEGYAFLCRWLTEAKVAQFLLPLRPRGVERYEMPGIRALNFLVRDVLAGGASLSSRTDCQGKALASAILDMSIPKPAHLNQMLRSVASSAS
ncbi:MAG: hypothetical protein NT069_28860 [Planctomycetota bacterium]|nr:hypothetical protein [Planctomycetota bacterium]